MADEDESSEHYYYLPVYEVFACRHCRFRTASFENFTQHMMDYELIGRGNCSNSVVIVIEGIEPLQILSLQTGARGPDQTYSISQREVVCEGRSVKQMHPGRHPCAWTTLLGTIVDPL